MEIDELCGSDATTANHRTFQLIDDDTTSALGNITNAYAATFIDLDEDVSAFLFYHSHIGNVMLMVIKGFSGYLSLGRFSFEWYQARTQNDSSTLQ